MAGKTSMIGLEFPWALLALPLPWLAYRLLAPLPASGRALYFPRATRGAVTEQRVHAGQGLPRTRLALLIVIWLALVAAACGPRWIGAPVNLPVSGRDLMLAVDISESMQIEDMALDGGEANRLELVKSVVGDFLRRRTGDRVGLILFGSNAYLHAPLTFDRATVGRLLDEALIGFAGKQTAIGDALAIAVKRLRDRPAGSRVLILLTDGANTAGSVAPRQAAELAASTGLRVYTIGIGSDVMEVPGLFGGMFGARRINPSADLDEDTLRYIARVTGGRYFRARDQRELEQIYTVLDRLEPVEQDAHSYRPTVSLAHWPLALALLLSLGFALRSAWPRRAEGAA